MPSPDLRRTPCWLRTRTALFVCLITLLCASAHAKVVLEGIDGELANNVLSHMTLDEQDCSAPDWRIRRERREAVKEIHTALQAFGYYSPEVQQEYTRDESCWLVTYRIDRGKRTKIRELDLQILERPEQIHHELQSVIDDTGIQPGMGLNHSRYDRFKLRLLETARNWGYWQANYERAELAVYPKDYAADVHLHLHLGPRYVFGATHFETTKLHEKLVARLTPSLEGQAYSNELVQDMYADLRRSGYFGQILVTPQVSDDPNQLIVPLDVALSMDSKHSFGAGLGYSTDQGFRARGDYQNRYINRRGHKLRFDALYAQTESAFSGTYTIPGRRASKEWYELGGGISEEETSSYTTRLITTSARSIKTLPYDWLLNYGVNLRNERYLIASDDIQNKHLVVPGIGVSWSDRDERPRQLYGLRFEAGLTGSSNYWKSDVDYLQLYTRSKSIVSFYPQGRFISRLEAANTLIEDFTELPPSVRFFTGGDSSVRGYDYESIGSTNEEGEVIGGRRLLVASVEYDHSILNNWSLSVFADAGDAFDDSLDLKRSVGVGVRWYSPVGPFRIDLAFPDQGDNDYRFHVSVGADI